MKIGFYKYYGLFNLIFLLDLKTNPSRSVAQYISSDKKFGSDPLYVHRLVPTLLVAKLSD